MNTQQVPSIEQIRGAWNDIAGGFDEFVTPETTVLGDEVVRCLGLRPGTRLLDVAAGSGALSIPAARVGADVVATDLAHAMIERLNARARAEGLSTLLARTMDGHALDLDDDAFDAAVSVNGVSLFPDMARGLAELVRVTRPGGRVVIDRSRRSRSSCSSPEQCRPRFATSRRGRPTRLRCPSRRRTPMYCTSDWPTRACARSGSTRSRGGWRSIPSSIFWNVFTASNPIGAQMVARLSNEQRADVTHALEGMLRERSAGAPGAVLRAEVNVGIGTV